MVNYALQTRQHRLESLSGGKSKIPPVVGQEHVRIGRLLSGSVVCLTLLGVGFPIFCKMLENQVFSKEPLRVIFVIAMYFATVASLFFLYMAKTKKWRD